MLVDTVSTLPRHLVLLGAITTVMTQSSRTLIAIGLGVVSIPAFARLNQANTLPFAQPEMAWWLPAARWEPAQGGSCFRGILPNVLFPVGSYAFIELTTIVVGEG